MKIFNITRVATGAGIAGALAVAAFAYASANKAPAPLSAAAVTDPAKLPTFENVRVVNATPEQIAALAVSADNSAYAPGQRAYIDANTKQLRPAFPEELAAEAATARRARVAAPRTTSIASPTDDGAKGVALDESFMSYAVARIEADGSVKQDCLENQPSEQAALAATVAAPGVDRHEK